MNSWEYIYIAIIWSFYWIFGYLSFYLLMLYFEFIHMTSISVSDEYVFKRSFNLISLNSRGFIKQVKLFSNSLRISSIFLQVKKNYLKMTCWKWHNWNPTVNFHRVLQYWNDFFFWVIVSPGIEITIHNALISFQPQNNCYNSLLRL